MVENINILQLRTQLLEKSLKLQQDYKINNHVNKLEEIQMNILKENANTLKKKSKIKNYTIVEPKNLRRSSRSTTSNSNNESQYNLDVTLKRPFKINKKVDKYSKSKYHLQYGIKHFKIENYEYAIKSFKKGALLSNIKCINRIGWMYFDGMGVDKDINEAKKWWLKSVELKSGDAMNNIGLLHRSGLGLRQNFRLAMRWFKRGAELKDAYCMYNIGEMYEMGQGMASDLQAAQNWYKRSAKLGYDAAKDKVTRLATL